ncbi:MAG: YhfC family glutamic-type intramembrane protease [Candidatus Aminicenantales bacterium]
MLNSVPYIIYFLGPFFLAYLLGKRYLKEKLGVFGIGLLVFFAAWVCIMIVTQVPAALSESLKERTLLYSIIVSASAGLFEESSRFFAFRIFRPLRESRDWNTGIMYAIGHSGMESIIVGGNLLLTAIVVKYSPEVLSPELLSKSKEILEAGFHQGLYNSLERLLVGLLVHSCFTFVVIISLIRNQKKYLLFAMLWHFGHDMVGFNLSRLSDHWIVEKLWILFIVVVYSLILLKLRRHIGMKRTL